MRNKFLLLGLLGLVFLLDAVAFGQEGRLTTKELDQKMLDAAEAVKNGYYRRATHLMGHCVLELDTRVKEGGEYNKKLERENAQLQGRIDALKEQIDALEQRNRNLYGAGIAFLAVAVLLIVCWILGQTQKPREIV